MKMTSYTDKIREAAKRLLEEGKVDFVIGFRKGSVPLMNQPHYAKTPAEVDQLIWDSSCGLNVANYLTDRKEKIGVVAKGCDSRNIVTHIVENKIDRDQIYVIGVPCKGMVDRHKIAGMVGADITEVEEDDETITVKTVDDEKSFNKTDLLQQNCAACNHRNPVIQDEMIAEPVKEGTELDMYESVREIEAMEPEERWKYFDELISTCIRCYACRNACPLCYCPLCFVDESDPQWVGKSQDPMDVRTFHWLRAYHCAGRCTDCGACERVCPMGIRIREFTKKLNKDCHEIYGWEAGLTTDERPPLDTYRPNDPEEFIK
jgi:ferredoxin